MIDDLLDSFDSNNLELGLDGTGVLGTINDNLESSVDDINILSDNSCLDSTANTTQLTEIDSMFNVDDRLIQADNNMFDINEDSLAMPSDIRVISVGHDYFGEIGGSSSDNLIDRHDSFINSDDNLCVSHEGTSSFIDNENSDLTAADRLGIGNSETSEAVNTEDSVYHPSFQGDNWTKSEINAKIREADDKISYYKAKVAEKESDIRGYSDPVKIASLGRDRDSFQREVEKWQGVKRKWVNMK